MVNSTPSANYWPLDLPLVRWSKYPRDTWTLQDALQDVIVFGQKGSGKTSASGRLFARKFLQAGFGGIVLCAQEEEAQNWGVYLRETGREGDGRFFSLAGPHRFNPLAWEAQKSGGVDFAENVLNLLLDVASIRKAPTPVYGEAPFWGEQKRKLLRNSISLLMLAAKPVTLEGLYQVVRSAPRNPGEAEDPIWKRGSYAQGLLTEAERADGGHPDLVGLKNFFLSEWPRLDDRHRPAIESDLTGFLDPLTRGKLAALFGTTTDLSPDDLEEGKVIVVDIPMKHREIAQYAALLWLQSVYRFADRRPWNPPHTRPLFVFIDETQYYLTPADARFQSTSRHHGFSVVRLTQSLPGLRAACGSQDETDALLSHCCTRIFHLQTCAITNKWASDAIGQDLQVRHSVSGAKDNGQSPQASFAEAMDASCPPQVFMDLKSGGKRHKRVVEAVVTQAGRTFLDRRRWIVSAYHQAKQL